MCIELSTRIKGLKTEDFLTKMPQNLAFLFWAQMAKNLAQSLQENGAKKIRLAKMVAKEK